MDTIQIEKVVAMKRYEKKQLVISSLIQYSLQASVVGLFLSSPSWLPKVYYTAKLFLSTAMGPRCLFIVSNIIIIFLVGESKISRPTGELGAREENEARSDRSIRRVGNGGGDGKEEGVVEGHFVEECGERDIVGVVKEEDGEEEEEEEEKVVVEEEEETEKGGVGEEEERESEEEEEERGLPAEELKRRVEDFIAKVNMQRRLEARMVIC